MPRLFVACIPPPDIRLKLRDIMGGIEGARWQKDAQLHITLRFIGEVDARMANDIGSALSSVHAPSLTLSLKGVGAFDRKGKVHSLWAGIAPAEPLAALHARIDRALGTLGLPPEQRAYRPHITLARLARPLDAVAPFLALQGSLASVPFDITEFGLYESLPTNEGNVYRCAVPYPLTPVPKAL